MDFRYMGKLEAYHGSLETGKFTKIETEHEEIYKKTLHPVKITPFSNRDVIILCNPSNNDFIEDDNGFIKDINRRKIKQVQYNDVDKSHEWDEIALDKLGDQDDIVLVENAEPYIATTIGDIEYHQRLKSFYKDGNLEEETVHPVFNSGRFDPKELAKDGLEHYKSPYDDNIFHARECTSDKKKARILMEEDAITSQSAIPENSAIYGFKDNESFKLENNEYGLILDGGDEAKNAEIFAGLRGIKKIQDNPVFTRGGAPCNAAVVKLTGRRAYLLTPEDNKSELEFKTSPDAERKLFDYYEETLPMYLKERSQQEFETDSLPRLRRLLPKIDRTLAAASRLISEDATQKKKKELLVGFQRFYQEVYITKIKLHFSKNRIDEYQGELDSLREYLRHRTTWALMHHGSPVVNDPRTEWLIKDYEQKKEQAVLKLKEMEETMSTFKGENIDALDLAERTTNPRKKKKRLSLQEGSLYPKGVNRY